ncbi:MAG: single-stranded-DNA-specific exonuclease RecJ [Cytophagales bacterium]|nr:single-stranded-DNA-specific exonuclease RecJ [Cytophagales bacterium]
MMKSFFNLLWRFQALPEAQLIAALSRDINVNDMLATLLIQRGITNYAKAKEYFRPDIAMLHDPFLMSDMDIAVARLNKAIENNEKILVYGDYDVDGTTAVAMMYLFIKSIHPHVEYYIPDRYAEGYGLSRLSIDYAATQGISLMITLDCGIKSTENIKYGNEKGIDFIVCDHHTPGLELPPALAILDPKKSHCKYPYKELSGCGVGFKLIQAYSTSHGIAWDKVVPFIEFAAISIGADIVPITGENRILTHWGIKIINDNPSPGVLAITRAAGIKKSLNIHHVVFGLAPRINAAGRIGHGSAAVKMLISPTADEAEQYANILNDNNSSRKDLDSHIAEEAIALIEAQPDFKNLKSSVICKPDWHKGVIGIVASRCIEKYYRPTIVLTETHGILSGSARSVAGFDVYHAIEQCADVLLQYGGHMYAAGLTLEKHNLELFKQKFEQVVSATITKEQQSASIQVDMEVPFSYVNTKCFDIIKQMEPFGPGNMTPIFCTRHVLVLPKSGVVGNNHLKLYLKDTNSGIVLDGVMWEAGHLLPKILNKHVEIAYSIQENEYRGNVTLQLLVRDIMYKE